MQKSKIKTSNKLSTISSKKIFANKPKLNCSISVKYNNYGCLNARKFTPQKNIEFTKNIQHVKRIQIIKSSSTYKASSKFQKEVLNPIKTFNMSKKNI